MNHPAGASLERRRHVRISPKGTVTLNVLGLSQRGRIANLAKGGLFVLTEVTAPQRWLGLPAEVEIRLDGGHAEWVRGTGRIVRLDGDGVGIAFDAPPLRHCCA